MYDFCPISDSTEIYLGCKLYYKKWAPIITTNLGFSSITMPKAKNSIYVDFSTICRNIFIILLHNSGSTIFWKTYQILLRKKCFNIYWNVRNMICQNRFQYDAYDLNILRNQIRMHKKVYWFFIWFFLFYMNDLVYYYKIYSSIRCDPISIFIFHTI